MKNNSSSVSGFVRHTQAYAQYKYKRIVPRAEGGVVPLQYSKQEFERPTFTIVKYTQALRRCNRDIAQRELSKEEVREQYTLALLSLYHPDDVQCTQLIDQVRALTALCHGAWLNLNSQAESPAYHNYWSELADRESYLQRKKTRDPTTGISKQWDLGQTFKQKVQSYDCCWT